MRKFTVAVDLDGVIWDLLTPWLKLYNDVFDDDLTPEKIETYSLWKYTKCEREDMFYLLERNDIWSQITIEDKQLEALRRLMNNERIDFIIVTATNYKVALNKFHRLYELLPELREDQLVITSRKDLIRADFLIDDWEDNLKHIAADKHGTAILITQPYNATFPNTQYGILRTDNLLNAVEIIEKNI